MNLSAHFTLEEFTVSDTAERLGIDNSPTAMVMGELQRLADFMELVRDLLEVPIVIKSGYRCPRLNTAVKGAVRSDHLVGRACDFIAPRFGSPYEVARTIESAGLQYGQLIHEFGRWVHISIPPQGQRAQREELSYFVAGRVIPGLREFA